MEKGHISASQEIQDELKESLEMHAEYKAAHKARYSWRSSAVNAVQEEKTTPIKEKPPRSPRVEGVDNLLRTPSGDDMLG